MATAGALLLTIGTAGECRAQGGWIGTGALINVDSTWTPDGHFTTGAVSFSVAGRVSRHVDVRLLYDDPASATVHVVKRDPSTEQVDLIERRHSPGLTLLVGIGPTRERWAAAFTAGVAALRHDDEASGTLADHPYSRRSHFGWDGLAFGVDGEYRLTPHVGVTAEARVNWFPLAENDPNPSIFRTGVGLRYHF